MAAATVLSNPHVTDHWSAADLARLGLTDAQLAEFLAAAPKMARALNAIQNLDLGTEAERLVRSEIRDLLA